MNVGGLKKRPQFLDITNKGHKAVTKSFVVFCAFDFIESQRAEYQSYDILFGLTVTKKNGNAVQRNRIKRRLRHLAREMAKDAPDEFKGAGLVVIGRYGAVTESFEDMKSEWNKCLNWLRKQK